MPHLHTPPEASSSIAGSPFHSIERAAARLFLRAPLGRASHDESAVDASVLPRGVGDARVLSAWTRYDELFGTAPGLTGFPRNIAYSLTTDSLRRRAAAVVRAIGDRDSRAGGRSDVSPHRRQPRRRGQFTRRHRAAHLEYGLTSHLTLDVVVPLVETRTTVFQQLNPKLGAANVGPNPSLTNSQLRASEATLVSSFRSAAAALTQQLAQCQATPDARLRAASRAAGDGANADPNDRLDGDRDRDPVRRRRRPPGTGLRSPRQQPDPGGHPGAQSSD